MTLKDVAIWGTVFADAPHSIPGKKTICGVLSGCSANRFRGVRR